MHLKLLLLLPPHQYWSGRRDTKMFWEAVFFCNSVWFDFYLDETIRVDHLCRLWLLLETPFQRFHLCNTFLVPPLWPCRTQTWRRTQVKPVHVVNVLHVTSSLYLIKDDGLNHAALTVVSFPGSFASLCYLCLSFVDAATLHESEPHFTVILSVRVQFSICCWLQIVTDFDLWMRSCKLESKWAVAIPLVVKK